MKKYFLLFALAFALTMAAMAQTSTSGDIVGTLTDSTGAVIPSAKITVTNEATGATKTVNAGANGGYRISLLTPGAYKVSVSASGFANTTNTVVVSVGVVATDDLKLSVGPGSTTVEVSAAPELLNTSNSDITTVITAEQIQALPNPGNDLTFVAQTAPGTVMNTGTAAGGYGNFSSFGISGLSNMFTLDGGYENDPFLNLNNTGASNLTLGNNEVDTVTIVAPAYSSQFGGLGGAQVNEITQSGSNHVHGNLSYYWNGRALNANDFFNKQVEVFTGQKNIPTFVNANQWGASIGGPALKDKLFWFINTEGIRAITPQNANVSVPNQLAQNCSLGADAGGTVNIPGYGPITYASCATLNAAADTACVAGGDGAQVGNLCGYRPFQAAPAADQALMRAIFGVYNNTPYRASTPLADPNDPAAIRYYAKNSAILNEWLLTARIDYQIGPKDHFFIHYKQDHGVQPTYTDLIDPRFTASSVQPAWEGQINETHSFSPNLVNQLVLTGNYYSAPFQNNNNYQSVAPFVYYGGAFNGSIGFYGGENYAFPQGRRVSGYQVIDDLSWTKGRNTFRFGYNIRRDNVTDIKGTYTTPLVEATEEAFLAGLTDYAFIERFPNHPTVPISLYNEGAYVEGVFKLTPQVTLTAGLRMERDSNPVCHTNCFADLAGASSALPLGTASTTVPYSAAYPGGLILGNRKRAFTGLEKLAFMPRVALNYQFSKNTVIKAGFGMFTDSPPAVVADTLSSNLPEQIRPTVYGDLALGNGLNFDLAPGAGANSAFSVAQAATNAFRNGYAAGGTYTSIRAATLATAPYFAVPSFTTVAPKLKYPTYEEFSFGIDQMIDHHTTLSLLYVGNHGYHEPVSDGTQNLANARFTGVPTARPVTALNTITNIYTGASSNYNGVVVSGTRRAHNLTVQVNYQFSKALDEISNGGLEPFAPDAGDSASLIVPGNLHANYGPADYNVKHNITGNFVYSLPILFKSNNRLVQGLVGGFEFSGAAFHQSGLPYSITQSTTGGGQGIPSSFSSGGVELLARKLNNNYDRHCGGAAHVQNTVLGTVANPCNFVLTFGTPTSFVTGQSRNSLIGPSYTNVDFGAFKTFGLSVLRLESAKLKVGAQFFNLFNHTNFQHPDNGRGADNTAFGGISSTVGAPTSILGSVGAADASPRLIQLHALLNF